MKASFWKEQGPVAAMLALIVLERIVVMCMLGTDYNIANDDIGYIGSGIRFLSEGIIGIYSDEPSAMIMPGMTWLLAAMTWLFGQGEAYWLAVKLLWIAMGTCTAWVTYVGVRMFAPRWCGLLALVAFLVPNVAWMDNIILTETPYFLCFTLTVVLTLMMGRSNSKGVFAGYCVAYMAGVLLRPTLVVMPVFSLAYLFLLGVDRKLLLRRMITGIVILLLFMLPWSARNYALFDHFVPLTYGTGNPMLLGSYQGFGYPEDSPELDAAVEAEFRETYAEYLDEDGNVKDSVMTQFLTLQKDGIKADLRMEQWWDTHPLQMLVSYLGVKPGIIVFKSFYWEELFGVPELAIDLLRGVNFLLCCLCVVLALKRKQLRMELGFLTVVYWLYVFMIGLTFAFSRYGETLMSIRYILGAVGIWMLLDEIKQRKNGVPS